MRVSIIGTGYVGLITGVCLAEKGHHVVCVDVDSDKVAQINRGIPPIYEQDLEPLLERNVGSHFAATTDLEKAVLETELTLIAVGTPFDGEQIDLQYVKNVAAQIGETLSQKDEYHMVIVKSTVVPGTTEKVVMPIVAETSGKTPGKDFGVGVNPEFLSEGVAVYDFMNPDRLVLGSYDQRGLALLEELYAAFPEVPRVKVNLGTAEMIKYASNSVLATLISFSNEIGNLCSTLGGIDVVDVMRGLHLSQYLSPVVEPVGRVTAPITAFLGAGCGYGGSCLPKDVQALVHHGEVAGQPMPLLRAVTSINDAQTKQMVGLLKKHFDSLADVKVAVLGLAFKPGTDDMRQSPSIKLIRHLVDQKALVTAYDPIVNGNARDVLDRPNVNLAGNLETAVANADALMLVTAWDEFRQVPEMVVSRTPQPVCIDGRRMWSPRLLLRYEGIGI